MERMSTWWTLECGISCITVPHPEPEVRNTHTHTHTHEPNSATSSTSGSSKRIFHHQWLACSNVLACSWWSLECLLAATQNQPISYQKVLVNLAACWHSSLENNRPSACCRSCWASVEDRLWIHSAVGHWVYQAKEEEQVNVTLSEAWK